MADIGAEVGQKMRSAIKAKLTELDCYVDDELPDYIMVMIANKRTKSQMKDDLQLFLSNKTTAFVDWLNIVLKKLKEVHVTNPDVFKKPGKRKSSEFTTSPEEMKKIKKEKKEEAKALKKARKDAKASKDAHKSLTDDLPITANKLSGLRKIVVMTDDSASTSNNQQIVADDNFDIPLLSEINVSNEDELELIERKIKSVKSRLGLLVESDDEDCLNIKADPEDLQLNDQLKKDLNKTRKITVDTTPEKRQEEDEEETSYTPTKNNQRLSNSDTEENYIDASPQRKKITFDKEKDSLNAKYASIINKRNSDDQHKKKSVLDRLGKRNFSDEKKARNYLDDDNGREFRRDRHENSNNDGNKHEMLHRSDGNRKSEELLGSRSEVSNKQEDIRERLKARFRNDRRRDDNKSEKPKEGIMSRLGVMSKISIPPKRHRSPEIEIDEEEEFKRTLKEVPSVVKVKPRILPPKAKQANPNLLLKAVAEAQRSVAQITKTKTINDKSARATSPTALFTKRYKEKFGNKPTKTHESKSQPKLNLNEKQKLMNLLNKDFHDNAIKKASFEESDEDDYTEKSYTPPRKILDTPTIEESNGVNNQQFIVTLDGIDKTKFGNKSNEKSVVKIKRTPSPIVFDKPKRAKIAKLSNIPDKLPIVPIVGLKNKEKCKFWPGCRQGDKCEFSHPSTACKMFPNCKFEDKCLYIHPSCKFEASCTRRDCPYSHKGANKIVSRVPLPTSIKVQKASAVVSQICKFFPNCSNQHCTFYHPRLCKFGNYCKNQKECNFVHSFSKIGGSGANSAGGNLTWRPENKI